MISLCQTWCPYAKCYRGAWWRHIIETLSESLVLCEGNPPMFPSQKMMQSFTDFFVVSLKKLWCKWRFFSSVIAVMTRMLPRVGQVLRNPYCWAGISRNSHKTSNGHERQSIHCVSRNKPISAGHIGPVRAQRGYTYEMHGVTGIRPSATSMLHYSGVTWASWRRK